MRRVTSIVTTCNIAASENIHVKCNCIMMMVQYKPGQVSVSIQTGNMKRGLPILSQLIDITSFTS